MNLLAEIIVSFFGPIGRWLGRKMFNFNPNVSVIHVYDSTSEDHLKWWHIDVKNVRKNKWWEKYFDIDDAVDCRIQMKFSPASSEGLIEDGGMWAQAYEENSQNFLTLDLDNTIGRIPIVVMSSKNTSLRGVNIEPFKAYITGIHYQHHKRHKKNTGDTLILDSVNYDVRIEIYSSKKKLFNKLFRLNVPTDNLQNFKFNQLTP